MSAVFHLNNKEAKRELKVNFNNETLPFCSEPKFLGVTLDRSLTYRRHLESLRKKLTARDRVVRLFFCATLTGHRGGHTSLVQAGAETSDTSAVKPYQALLGRVIPVGWVPMSEIKMWSLVGLSVHSSFHC